MDGLGNTHSVAISRCQDMSVRFRLWGLLPLAAFLLHLQFNWTHDVLGNTLWMCLVSNLFLAIGVLCAQASLIRLAVIWLIPGVPLWLMDMLQFGMVTRVTFLSHLGGTVLGLVALRRVGAARRTWVYAFVWYLVLQQLSRMVTPPELNVNVAHTIYPGWERFFGAYWQYWMFTTVSAAAGLWVIGRMLLLWAPPAEAKTADYQAIAGV